MHVGNGCLSVGGVVVKNVRSPPICHNYKTVRRLKNLEAGANSESYKLC